MTAVLKRQMLEAVAGVEEQGEHQRHQQLHEVADAVGMAERAHGPRHGPVADDVVDHLGLAEHLEAEHRVGCRLGDGQASLEDHADGEEPQEHPGLPLVQVADGEEHDEQAEQPDQVEQDVERNVGVEDRQKAGEEVEQQRGRHPRLQAEGGDPAVEVRLPHEDDRDRDRRQQRHGHRHTTRATGLPEIILFVKILVEQGDIDVERGGDREADEQDIDDPLGAAEDQPAEHAGKPADDRREILELGDAQQQGDERREHPEADQHDQGDRLADHGAEPVVTAPGGKHAGLVHSACRCRAFRDWASSSRS